jgi:chromosome condensin MukBEF ATPase and DNA-binding subunit MukB
MTLYLAPIKLPIQDWDRILQLGADSRTHELQAELSRAQQAVARFEARFGMSLTDLEKIGLPTNADFETHAAYIEWQSWEIRRTDLQKRLTTLHSLETGNGG